MTGLERLAVIGRTYRHLARYQQIVRVLFKYGFGDLVDTLHVRRYLDAVLNLVSTKKDSEEVERLTRPERLRLVLQELGPTFIKLGQILSTRPDLLPYPYLEELGKLQTDVPSFPFAQVRTILREELGGEPDEVFRTFDEVPVGSASMAQGHRATLQDGGEVFVKVQRPGIRELIKVDLEILHHLASVLEGQSEEARVLKPTRIVDEFARSFEREMDFTAEASNIRRFARQFQGRAGIHAPRVHGELSTSRVITMEFVSGLRANDLEGLRASGCDLPKLAKLGAELVLEQVFTHGFFHADPHPGNLYVLDGPIICYLDFGMMGRITRGERQDLAELLWAISTQREHRAAMLVLKLTNYDIEPEHAALERDVAQFIDQFFYLSLGEVDFSRAIAQIYAICRRHGLSPKPQIYMLGKALATMEEFGRRLDPAYNLSAHVRPFVRKLYIGRLNPLRILRTLGENSTDFLRFAVDFPEQLRAIMELVRKGGLKLELEHRGLESMIHSHERLGNRIASAIVLAAMIVGSSLMTLSNVPPKWNGIPVLGLGGFLLAGILGLRLLWDIHRSG
ncbi:MAG: AarF/ABC1/UbiB kinase family protein [Lentisphaeria bacterium]|nr:AarF/ABC1/UbiB kinase family protein [Lentisphaeria bacterium]